MAYKDKFVITDYPEGVVDATKKIMRRLWKKDLPLAIKIKNVEKWINDVCCLYGIEFPTFVFSNNKQMYQATGGGAFYPELDVFFLFSKLSLTTLLHEFRHYMQYKVEIPNCETPLQKEEDARGWSCSLFFLCNPEAYQKAVDEGRLHFE